VGMLEGADTDVADELAIHTEDAHAVVVTAM
jgi:hypothetical protein